jgi:hypothetical protein
MSIIDKKKEVFGKIGAARTLIEGLPKLKLSSSFPSVNNSGDRITFLTDLIKSLIGFEALVSSLVDILTYTLSKIEKEIKKALKLELKNITSCGVDPHLPTWITSNGSGIIIEVSKIDLFDILRTDPNTLGGKLIYNDITTPLINSTDFNTFLYGVIQNDGTTYAWQNIFDITFNSIGTGGNPNNTLTIKANSNYNTKTLTDLNNDYIDSLTLLSTENIINKVMDIIYGSISSNIGKSLKQLESEAKINTVIDKMSNNVNNNPISDSAFSFSNEETYAHQLEAINRKNGTSSLNVSSNVPSTVPMSDLTNFNNQLSTTTSTIQKKASISDGLDTMANSSVSNVTNPVDIKSSKLNFIQKIINTLIKSVISIILSPKVVFTFLINYKIVYGPTATYDDALDFLKKNKNLINNLVKDISTVIVKILVAIVLKEISALVAEIVIKREKEKALNYVAQLESLIGVNPTIIQNLLNSLT